jgi:hypothetical protein
MAMFWPGYNLNRGALSKPERTAYTDAVLCLMSKPGLTYQTVVPGAKTRYDDFVWTHINQTLTIHGTVCYLHGLSPSSSMPRKAAFSIIIYAQKSS